MPTCSHVTRISFKRGFLSLCQMCLSLQEATSRPHIPYNGKLLRGKTLRIDEKYNFHGEKFHGLLALAAPKDTTPPNFAEKTFANSHKTVKFAKVSPSKSFPLYGILDRNSGVCTRGKAVLFVVSPIHTRYCGQDYILIAMVTEQSPVNHKSTHMTTHTL